ncbi:MAG TPA: cobalamin-dependent protein, partial [Planctomycetota bacterium]|nr:cobalamin-dependent protein [Planctomycetota bacterium]
MAATDIILCTLNARYSHAAMGLRYLQANLGELQPRAVIREFTIHDQPARIVEKLLAEAPRIIGFGIYIWNLVETRRVVGILRQVAPDVRIVIGGPEVTHEHADEPLAAACDVLITGEADLTFRQVCDDLLAG